MREPLYKLREQRQVEVPIDLVDPNPYRYLDAFPLENERLATLHASMLRTHVWDRIQAREMPDGRFQQAFGHHQIELMRKGGNPTVRLLVSDLSNAEMIQMLASENGSSDTATAMHIRNAVQAARDWLEWGPLESAKFGTPSPEALALFGGEAALRHALGGVETPRGWSIGAGRDAIQRFLGRAVSGAAIDRALQVLPQSSWAKARVAEMTPVWEAAKAAAGAEAKEEALRQRERAETLRAKETQAETAAREALAEAKTALAANSPKAEAAALAKAKQAAAEATRVGRDRRAAETRAKEKLREAATLTVRRPRAIDEVRAKQADDDDTDLAAINLFVIEAHGATFREACLERVGSPLRRRVPKQDQMALAVAILHALKPNSGVGPLKDHRVSNSLPTLRLNPENIRARVLERERATAFDRDLYWLLPMEAWRSALNRFAGECIEGAVAVHASELPQLVDEFLVMTGIAKRQGDSLISHSGTARALEEATAGAFEAFLWRTHAKRSNAVQFASELDRKVRAASISAVAAMHRATRALENLLRMRAENPGLALQAAELADLHARLGGLIGQLAKPPARPVISGEVTDAEVIDG